MTKTFVTSERAFIKVLMHVFRYHVSLLVNKVFVHVNIFDFNLAIGVGVGACLIYDFLKMWRIISAALTT